MPCRELILQTSVGGSAQEMRKAQESGEQTSQAKRKQDSRRLPHAAERGASQRNQHRDGSALVFSAYPHGNGQTDAGSANRQTEHDATDGAQVSEIHPIDKMSEPQ